MMPQLLLDADYFHPLVLTSARMLKESLKRSSGADAGQVERFKHILCRHHVTLYTPHVVTCASATAVHDCAANAVRTRQPCLEQ